MRKKIVLVIIAIVVGFLIVKGARYLPFFYQLLFNRTIELKKTQGRINILGMGIGGGQHEGPNLTDTIIFASIDPQAKKITLVSIPRDFWIPELNEKINAAYAFGEVKKKGGGLVLAKASVSKLLNQQIDYAIVVNFEGFVKAVDLVGGLGVDVENTFDDYEYPVEGKENDLCGHSEEELPALATASSQLDAFPCRYEHIHFDQGMQHMDGKTALKFVRSRHALGTEGSDFARSKRQEKVIAAFKNKLFSVQTLLDPTKLLNLYGIVEKSIDTDIKQDEFDDFIRLAQTLKQAKIESGILDYGDEKTERPGLLVNPTQSEEYGNEWVLIPRLGNGDYSEIQQYVLCEIQKGNCPISKTPSLKK